MGGEYADERIERLSDPDPLRWHRVQRRENPSQPQQIDRVQKRGDDEIEVTFR